MNNLLYIGLVVMGAGLSVLAASLGISKIGISALEAISRQPESADKIQNAMIIVSALIEGAALFGIVTALLAVLK
ncbi:MAG: ATP synthase F0 subunit C [Candidatus Bostrichicola ureolyticus]|nr:MAG: ATP synthase F0 subunit C [Candidatus Bostrichicola ureolyticus]